GQAGLGEVEVHLAALELANDALGRRPRLRDQSGRDEEVTAIDERVRARHAEPPERGVGAVVPAQRNGDVAALRRDVAAVVLDLCERELLAQLAVQRLGTAEVGVRERQRAVEGVYEPAVVVEPRLPEAIARALQAR